MGYEVGIDPGSGSTVAAVCRSDGSARVVPDVVPSAAYLAADGTLLVGHDAERRGLADPTRVVRELTSRVGDATPVLVGREPVAGADLVARFLTRVVGDVARQEGEVAARVAVTHPAGWGAHRVGALRAALAEHGLGSALLVAEPVAAAFAVAPRVGPGALVAVYDLGGARCTASVVRRGPDGFAVAGPVEELGFGGADLDEAVLGHVRAALGTAWEGLDAGDEDVLAAVADLRRECTAAKEALSRDTEVLVPVALPGLRTQVRLGRGEFEEAIRADVAATVEAMERALAAAGTSAAELAAVVLVGGSARVPLVPQLLGDALGREVAVAADPVGAAAVGAALLAHGPRPAAPARGSQMAVALPAHGSQPDGHPVVALPARGSQPDGRPVVALPARGSQPDGHPATVRPVPAGPGTVPEVAAAAPPDAGGTSVLPLARPPKQARPFVAEEEPSRGRRVVLLASAGALALAVLGGVVAFGAGRIGAGTEAGAVTPVVGTVTSAPTLPPPPPAVAPQPAPRTAAPPSRRARPAPPATSSPAATRPPATGASPTTSAPTSTTRPEPTEPAQGGDGGDAAGNGGGTGGGNGGGNGGGGNGGGGGGGGGGDRADEGGSAAGAANAPATAPAAAPQAASAPAPQAAGAPAAGKAPAPDTPAAG